MTTTNVETIKSSAMDENSYLVETDGRNYVVDPGMGTAEIVNEILDDGRVSIILTHGHGDHIIEIDKLYYDEICIHDLDLPYLRDETMSLVKFFGENPKIDFDRIRSPQSLPKEWAAFHTPGHTPGSCCFMLEGKWLFTGDTVFSNSIGRTDFEGGNDEQIFESLKQLKNLFALNPSLIILPGHGESATAGEILRENPFFK